MRFIKYVMVLTFLILLFSCSRPESYTIEVAAISEKGYGVIITDFPIAKHHYLYKNHGYRSKDNPAEIRAYPRNPSAFSVDIDLPPFDGYEGRKLPKEITFTYQLAQLSDCQISEREPARNVRVRKDIADSRFYFTKRVCKTWQPIANKKFTKTIDLTAVQNSQNMQKLGKRNKSASFSYHMATLIFEFYDDGEVKIKVRNTATNPWK